MTIPNFYNTNHEYGRQLLESDKKAMSQQKLIFAYMSQNQGRQFTPFDIQAEVQEFRLTPITSIRRAMTNLTSEGRLEQTHNMRPGQYGKLNHTWRVAKREVRQLSLF